MKLHEIITESYSGRGYASLTLNDESTKKIHDILKELGVLHPIDDLHITLIYDSSNPKIDMELDMKREYSATVDNIKTLGEPDSKWYAVALTLESNELLDRHNDYISAGFKHSYPKFIPHVSLKYNPTEHDIKIIKDNFDKFKKLKLIFGNEKLDVVDE